MELPASRKNIRLEVALTFEGSGVTVRAVAENISETGVLVRSPIMEPLGTVVGLEFREFKAKGEIIWTREIDEGALRGYEDRLYGVARLASDKWLAGALGRAEQSLSVSRVVAGPHPPS